MFRPQSILCIDDEETQLRIRALVLAEEGYDVVTATDGDEGLQKFKERDICLAIVDYSLPKRSGVEVAKEMKRVKPQVPVVLFTGYSELPEKATDCDAVMLKGAPVREFLLAIQKFVTTDDAR